ncbi:MAG: LysR substrate-binding domain-containing protein [Myxococcaceae bacterium]
MRWLNFHHLLYFWSVARTGSIAAASRELFLSPPAISTQIKTLETSVGARLLKRTPRGFELTDTGRLVFAYADDIFRIGSELAQALEAQTNGQRLRVGLGQMIPKLLAEQLLRPVFEDGPGDVVVQCREAWNETLFDELLAHELDVVIADAPTLPRGSAAVQQQLLFELPVGFYGSASHAHVAGDFPRRLDAASLLVPTASSGLRKDLTDWLERHEVRPRIAGEFDDGGLLITFAQKGLGIFAAPLSLRAELEERHGLLLLGEAEGLTVSLYGVATRRKLLNPIVRSLFSMAPAQVPQATAV